MRTLLPSASRPETALDSGSGCSGTPLAFCATTRTVRPTASGSSSGVAPALADGVAACFTAAEGRGSALGAGPLTLDARLSGLQPAARASGKSQTARAITPDL